MSLARAKILDLPSALAWRQEMAAAGRRLVATNGVFDLLHPGHAEYLEAARQLGDALVVCLNADVSVKSIKDPRRPIVDEANRAYMLASLACVDAVVLFSDKEALGTLLALRPDLYVKGGDYKIDTINQNERRALEAAGTEIRILHFKDGFSTTRMIQRVVDAYGPQ
ncbi:MAG: hypothetical protein RL095_2844 [Verrucomicrobiota bacterium]|jgi:rfaE bifunctional protein nucleotidyltransferase chain/domain